MPNDKTDSQMIDISLGMNGNQGIVVGNEATRQTQSTTADDPSREEWMRLAEQSSGLEFWNRPEEDIYTLDDGVPT
jgi:hypothetical protein